MEGDVVEITKAPIVSSVIRGISIVIIREWKKVEKLSQKYISRREFELTALFEGTMVIVPPPTATSTTLDDSGVEVSFIRSENISSSTPKTKEKSVQIAP